MTSDIDRLQALVAQIAASYFSTSHVPPEQIPDVIDRIAASLGALEGGGETPKAAPMSDEASRMTPARIAKSVTDGVLISFEDQRPRKTLKRHLRSLGLSPDAYRAKWGLPDDYPMVSADYSAHRADLARAVGLGQIPKHEVVPLTPRRRPKGGGRR